MRARKTYFIGPAFRVGHLRASVMVLELDGTWVVEGEHSKGEGEILKTRVSKSLGPSVLFIAQVSVEDRAQIPPTCRDQTMITGQVEGWGISSSEVVSNYNRGTQSKLSVKTTEEIHGGSYTV